MTDTFHLIEVPNVLAPDDRIRSERPWVATSTLKDYFYSEEVTEAVIAVNGKIIPMEEHGQTYLQRGDFVVFTPLVAGSGNGGKNVLRAIILIITIIVAVYTGVGWGLVAAELMMFFSKHPKPKTSDTATYGADGPINTSEEGLVAPVVYGTFRYGGNVIENFVENAGTTQYLYMLFNAGEGQVANITDIWINDEDPTHYTGIDPVSGATVQAVTTQVALGTPDQMPLQWFGDTMTPQTVDQNLSQAWAYFTTQDIVDMVRVDLIAAAGLYTTDSKGNTDQVTVPLEIQYAPAGTDPNSATGWAPLPVIANVQAAQQVITWNSVNTFVPSSANSYVGTWQYEPYVPNGSETNDGQYVYNAAGAVVGTIQNVAAPTLSGLTFQGNSKNTLRLSFTSKGLPEATYTIRVRRTTVEQFQTNPDNVDRVTWNTLTEIVTTQVAYRNTALVAVRVLLGDQISGVPTVTYINHGKLVPVYDTTTGWSLQASSNPAWITLDILTNNRYGGGAGTIRTNLLPNSQAVQSWSTLNNVTVTPNATTAPDGTTTACEVQDTTDTSAVGHFAWMEMPGLNPGAYYVYSAYLKAGTASQAVIRFGQAQSPFATAGATIDLTTGLAQPLDAGQILFSQCGATAVGNGWYRAWVATQIDTTTTDFRATVGPLSSEGLTYQGTGSNSIYFWGGQVETGSAPTNYIPTTSAAASVVDSDFSRFDFDTWVTWAQYCDANGLEFNGVFDQQETVWDAATTVARLGHAALLKSGTKYTVAMEAPGNPVMMFSVANMVQDTFVETWSSLQDRANVIEGSYYDKDDLYRERTIRVFDQVALSTGVPEKVTQVDLQGVTSAQQAWNELNLLLNVNRYIQRTVKFSAPLDALACQVGDVVLVQHDMPQWGFAGRTLPGYVSTTTINLDREVTMEYGVTYSVLVHQPSLERYSGNVTSVTNSTLFTQLVLSNFDGQNPVKRIVINGIEYPVNGVFQSGSNWGVTLDPTPGLSAGGNYTLYDQDAMDTRQVVNPATEGSPVTTTQLTVASPFNAAPADFANWMFGPTTQVAKPFRISAITASHEYTRDITAVEYNSSVYSPAGAVPTPNYSSLAPGVQQVTITGVSETTQMNGATWVSFVTCSYSSTDPFYGTANVYLSRNGGGATLVGTDPRNVTVTAAQGESLIFKVVAISAVGDQAAYQAAPVANYIVQGKVTAPTNVSGLNAQITANGIEFNWTAPTDPDWATTTLTNGSTVIYQGKGTHYTWAYQSIGTYTITATNQNAGQSSAAQSTTVTIVAPNVPSINPPVVSGLSVQFTWANAQSSLPVDHYEVRIGSSSDTWATATHVTNVSGGTMQLSYVDTSAATRQLFIMATDVGGNTSPIATKAFTSVAVVGQPGAQGAPGPRGTVQLVTTVTATAWSDATATNLIQSTTDTSPMNGDQVTESNPTAGYAETRFWSSNAWLSLTQYINGNLLVSGTVQGSALVAGSVTADRIDTRGLQIKDSNGNVLFTAGTTMGSGNILSNADFLLSSGGVPTGYGIYDNAGISITPTVVAGGPVGTSNFLQLLANAATTWPIGLMSQNNNAALFGGFKANTNYIISFYAAGNGMFAGAGMALHWNNAPSVQTELQNPNLIAGTWQRYVFRVNFGSGTIDQGFFIATVNGPAVGNALQIACLQIEVGDVVSGWAPAGVSGSNQITSANAAVYIANGSIGSAQVGTLTAGNIDTRGLSIKDAAGNIILSAGSSLATSTFNVPGAVTNVPATWLNSNSSGTNLYWGNTANPQMYAGPGQYGSSGIFNLRSGGVDAYGLQPGDILTISADLWCDSACIAAGQFAAIFIWASDANGTWQASTWCGGTTTTATRASATITLPSTATEMVAVAFQVFHQGTNATASPAGNVYANRIQVERGPVATQYSVGSQPNANATYVDSNGNLQGVSSGAGTSVANSKVTIAANGSLSGAGGGQVTISGLGYSGDLNATHGATWGTNVANTPANLSALSGSEAIQNSGISIAANGALNGAGGGQVTLDGMGAGPFATLSQITAANASTYIASAAIGSALIGNAAIVNANIASAAVNTLNIQGNAVTVPTSAYNANSQSITGSSSTIQTSTFSCTGQKVVIMASCVVQGSFTATNQYGGTATIVVVLSGGALSSSISMQVQVAVPGSSNVTLPPTTVVFPVITDVPPAGSVTYTMTASYSLSSATANSASASMRNIFTLEAKR